MSLSEQINPTGRHDTAGVELDGSSILASRLRPAIQKDGDLRIQPKSDHQARLKVLYYTRPCFLDCAMHAVDALSRLCELHVCLEVDPQGWRTSLFDLPSQHLPGGIRPAASLFREHFPSGVRRYWDRVSSFNLVVHNQKRNLHPSTWWRSWGVARLVKALRPHVLHLDDVSLRLAPLMWKFRTFPIVVNLHDPVPHSGQGGWKCDLMYWLSLRYVDRILVHSEFCKDLALRHLRLPVERVCVVPLGVYDIYREWMEDPGVTQEDTVLFVGRIAAYKGIEQFIQAARIASDRLKNRRFVIAGSPSPHYKLPPLRPLPNGNTIAVLDRYLRNQELARLLQQAAVVVCPYLDATQSGVILTAYAFNKPVIVTRVGGLPEYVWDGKTGMVVPPNDAGALAEAIIRFLTEAGLRERMRCAIQDLRTGSLSWERSAREMMSIYRELSPPHKNVVNARSSAPGTEGKTR